MSARTSWSLRNTLSTVLLALAVVPVIVFSAFFIIQFGAIQEREQRQKFSAQVDNVAQAVEFELAFFYARLKQASRDNVLAISAHTGTFGERARLKMDVLIQEHPMIGGVLLVDDNYEILSAVPTLVELLDISILRDQLQQTMSHGVEERADIHVINNRAFAQALRVLGMASKKTHYSDAVVVYIAPVVMSDSRISDAFAKTTGTLIAILPLENVFATLKAHAEDMHLDSIDYQGNRVASDPVLSTQPVISVTAPMRLEGLDKDWQLTFSRARDEAFRSVNELTQRYILLATVVVLLLLALSLVIARLFLHPLEALSKIVSKYLTRDYRPAHQDLYFREVQEIVDVLATMATQIQLDHQELEERVKARTLDLSNAMDQLQRTQEKLIEQEKNALLGQLVAGIAHEINTPLGICVTAGTTLSDNLKNLQLAYQSNKVSRKMFEDFFAEVDDGFRIMLANLERASVLMQNFKLVAVDSTSEKRREFNLYLYLKETVHSLAPELRTYNVKVDVVGETSLVLDSYPGAYAQIITNLVINSLRHGFTREHPHRITIEFWSIDKTLHLVYRDDGKGVGPDQLQKLFDPFYTTLSNKGGSGLGLNIVSNIVTANLQGRIRAESEVGRGLAFIMELPLVL